MVYYEPKTGILAGKRNFEKVKACLEKDPTVTGAEIAKKLVLSRNAVYAHLKKLLRPE